MSDYHWITVLHQSRQMETARDVDRFQEAVRQLRTEMLDMERLTELFLGFSDTSKHWDVMRSLVHLVESYEREMYIEALILTTPLIIENAREWLKTLYTRVLNTDDARVVLKRYVQTLSSDKEVELRSLLGELVREIKEEEAPEIANKYHNHFREIFENP